MGPVPSSTNLHRISGHPSFMTSQVSPLPVVEAIARSIMYALRHQRWCCCSDLCHGLLLTTSTSVCDSCVPSAEVHPRLVVLPKVFGPASSRSIIEISDSISIEHLRRTHQTNVRPGSFITRRFPEVHLMKAVSTCHDPVDSPSSSSVPSQ